MGSQNPEGRFWTRAALFLSAVYLGWGCTPSVDGSVPLTAEERRTITELVLSAAEDPEEAVAPAHDEIWSILKKHGAPTRRQLDQLKNRFLTIGEGHHLFWLDAREAVRNHRMVKSTERARWEEGLERDGWLSPKQRERFDDLMRHVVREEPIPANHGVEMALSETMVDEIVNSWDERELERSISDLLVPPK